METNIIVAGVGGQGSILASHIIASALIEEYGTAINVRVGETFGAAQRGGAVASHIRAGENVHGPLVRRASADLVVALEPLEALRIGIPYIGESGTVITTSNAVVPIDVKSGAVAYPTMEETVSQLSQLCERVVTLDGIALAQEVGNPKVLSTIMIGAAWASGKIPVSRDTMIGAIKKRVPPKTVDVNVAAFELGERAFLAS